MLVLRANSRVRNANNCPTAHFLHEARVRASPALLASPGLPGVPASGLPASSCPGCPVVPAGRGRCRPRARSESRGRPRRAGIGTRPPASIATPREMRSGVADPATAARSVASAAGRVVGAGTECRDAVSDPSRPKHDRISLPVSSRSCDRAGKNARPTREHRIPASPRISLAPYPRPRTNRLCGFMEVPEWFREPMKTSPQPSPRARLSP
jgi:hypothetical protein